MSYQVEKLEKSTAKLTIEVPAEQFAAALKNAYNKNKGKYNIPGFRRGKAPYEMMKKMYGVGVFYEDAANEVIDASYPEAAKESGLEIVSHPAINVEQIEEGKSFIYTAVIATKPEVTLGEYKGVEVKKATAEVTAEDIEAEINRERQKNSRLITVEDRAAENGDRVTIDFDGTVDGKHFDGGKSEDYSLTLGSHTFIDTFEDQIVGKNTGDEFDVNVTFPEEYHAAELKGKPAVFRVVLKEIQRTELPEVNDDFASEVSDFDTLDEYKKSLEEKLLKEKERAAEAANEDHVVEAVAANAQMEIADQMVEEQINGMINDYARRIQGQGIDFKQYMEITGLTTAKLGEQMRPEAEKRIRTRLTLEAVVKAENITADDEAVEAEFDKMATAYKMEKDQLKSMFGGEQLDQMKEDIAVQKAIDFLVAEAKFVD